jgi:hypothetical protein
MPLELRQSTRKNGAEPNVEKLAITSDENGYNDTWANFAIDFGQPLPALPANVSQRIYIPGVRHDLMSVDDPGGTVVATEPMPWPLGDEIFDNLQTIIANQMARQTPPGGLLQTKASKANELRNAANNVINNGFVSWALGSPHLYPSIPPARADMTASVTASLLPDLPEDWTTPFWCQDGSTGKAALVDHTAEQIRQAGSDGKAFADAAEQKLAGLLAQVDAAETTDAVNKIIWR